MTESEEARAVPEPELTGIGGWLILPLVQLVFGPPFLLWTLCQRLPYIGERVPQHAYAAQGAFILLMLPLVVFELYCLVRFLQKRREVPWLMTALYGINITSLIVILIARLKGYDFPDTIAAQSMVAGHTVPSLVQIAIQLTLIFCFHNSVRVSNTFTVVGGSRERELKGLGGWLILPLVTVVFFFAITLTVIMRTAVAPRMLFAFQHGHWLVFGRQLFLAALAQLGSITCLFYALRQKRAARWLLIGYFALWASVSAISLAFEAKFNPVGLAVGLLCLALVAYLLLSRRVKNTFVK